MTKPRKQNKQRMRLKLLARKTSALETSWIASSTGKSRLEWIGIIQGTLKKISKPTKDKWHDTNDPIELITRLARDVRKTFPKQGRFDGNMRMTATLGYLCCLFYLRLHKAKSFDPRRPVAARKQAYFQRQQFAQALLNAIIDESLDCEMFPSQNWESPWIKSPTDGYFV
jgi:hypothetical protein